MLENQIAHQFLFNEFWNDKAAGRPDIWMELVETFGTITKTSPHPNFFNNFYSESLVKGTSDCYFETHRPPKMPG